MSLEDELGIEELRRAFLDFSLAAYACLPKREGIRLLDVGCGRGTTLVELSRRYDAELVGIDVDESVLEHARAAADHTERIRIVHCGLLDNDFDDSSFDVVWEEGVLHVLDDAETLPGCHRLLKPGGHLVSAETLLWHRDHADAFARAGFERVGRVDWEPGCWWTRYYAPLEERIARLRAAAGRGGPSGIERYEAEVRAVKADVGATDCSHFIYTRS